MADVCVCVYVQVYCNIFSINEVNFIPSEQNCFPQMFEFSATSHVKHSPNFNRMSTYETVRSILRLKINKMHKEIVKGFTRTMQPMW